MKQEAISKKKRIVTMLIAFLFVIATLFSVAFVIKEASHKCNHTDCQICQTMQLCIKNLTDLGSKSDDNVGVIVLFYFTLFIIPFVTYIFSKETLIDLKTKLSN
ncbi:hypothetical protein [Eubacterium sp.]